MAVVDESTGRPAGAYDAPAREGVAEPAFRTAPPGPAEVTVNLFGFVQTLVRGRKMLLWATVAGFLLGLALFFVTRPYFVAEASFLPPQQQQQSPFSALGSLLQSQVQTDSTDTYLALLQSRSVLDDVVDQTDAMKRFHTQSRLLARATIQGMSKSAVSKNQLVTVTVKNQDPQFAADVANAFLEALYRQNGRMVTSASSHREQFFRGQLEQQKEELNKAETDLRKTQERTGLVLPEGEATAGIAATAQLQQQINESESRLSGLLAGATEQNPQVVQARKQIAALRGALARQQATTGIRKPGGGLPSTSELPQLTMENLDRQRELKLQETLYQSLMQQYEQARLSSVDPGPQLQIVDRAIRPERKAGPRTRYYAGGGAALGFFGVLCYLLLSGPVGRFRRTYRQYSAAGGPKA